LSLKTEVLYHHLPAKILGFHQQSFQMGYDIRQTTKQKLNQSTSIPKEKLFDGSAKNFSCSYLEIVIGSSVNAFYQLSASENASINFPLLVEDQA
jgi:hypothetical protein